MDDRARVTCSACVGAALGGLVGFLLFTARGRRFRSQIGPQLTALGEELREVHGVVGSLRDAVGGGWRGLSSLITELAGRSESAEPAEATEPGPARFH